jgi:hypothetical protein
MQHLKLVGYSIEQGPAQSEQIVCRNCVHAGEASRQLRKSHFSPIKWLRRLGI